MGIVDKSERFWRKQRSPRHRSGSEDFYRRHARELKLLFPEGPIETVLDIGCGDGALYRELGFDSCRRYKGVDFSESMLEVFRERHGDVELERANGADYVDGETYDLIIANGVVQYFDRESLQRFITHGRQMVGANGALVLGSIPWRRLRGAFLRGELRKQVPKNLIRRVVSWARSLPDDGIGRWYSLGEIRALADKNRLDVELFGSASYLYRFHAVLRRR